MKMGRAISLASAGVVVLGVILLLHPPNIVSVGPKGSGKEPLYEGKSLSEWLENINDFGFDGPTPEAKKSREAVQAIGPAAVPFLVGWLQPPSSVFERIPVLCNLFKARTPPATGSRIVAALAVLGPEAKAAIPELARMLNRYKPPHSMKDYSTWHYAAEGISYLGPEAIPVLLQAATNIQGQRIQWELLENMGNLGTNGGPAIPALIHWCEDKDPWVRLGAVNALGEIGLEPRTVVPVLLKASLERRCSNR